MIYESKDDPAHGINALKKFYDGFMPNYGWKEIKEARKKNKLMYVKKNKPNEFCRIDMFRDESLTTLLILVGNENLVTAD